VDATAAKYPRTFERIPFPPYPVDPEATHQWCVGDVMTVPAREGESPKSWWVVAHIDHDAVEKPTEKPIRFVYFPFRPTHEDVRRVLAAPQDEIMFWCGPSLNYPGYDT